MHTENENLYLLAQSMSELSKSFGVDYTDLLHLSSNIIPNKYKIDTECGTAESIGIFKTQDIGIANLLTDKDTIIKAHSHHETEVFYVKKGVLCITLFNDNESEVISLRVGQTYLIQPNIVHELYWPEQSEVIDITIPASPYWPEAKNVNT